MEITLLLSLITLAYVAALVYYAWLWSHCKEFRVLPNKVPKTKVSIIVPARNEQSNIAACLQSLSEQSYPKQLFEIILVNDCSTDDTVLVAQKTLLGVRIIELAPYLAGEKNAYKKKAIEVGIAHANGGLIITVDADCVAPKEWLQTIVNFYEEKQPNFIALPVYIKPNGKLIGAFQSVDFAMLQGITAGAVHKGLHYMCNGANVAYTKSAFDAVNGFAGINNIASGDDMLLMHKIAALDAAKVTYLKHPTVIMQTQAVPTVGAFLNQRIRWASKSNHYQDKSLLPVLLLVYIFNVILFITALAGFYNAVYGLYFLYMLVLKIVAELFLLLPVCKFYNCSNYLLHFVFFQPFHIVYTLIAGFLGKFGNYTWKGRKVK